ncbi:MAG: hypothetical protein ACRDUV_22845 [Pseudonocardiaceae bacterium]
MSYEDQSHRFVITGEDPEGHPRTIILWRETDLVHGKVVRRVHVTLDATIRITTNPYPGEGRRGGGGDPGGSAAPPLRPGIRRGVTPQHCFVTDEESWSTSIPPCRAAG